MPTRKIPPIHPGEILLEEYLKPLGLSQYRLAKDITVPARRVNEIVHGKRAITADTASRSRRSVSRAGWSARFPNTEPPVDNRKSASRKRYDVLTL
jgi:addiction module HigA family antidote